MIKNQILKIKYSQSHFDPEIIFYQDVCFQR